MASNITVQDRKWRAEDDARTLAQVHEIKSDPKRLKAAINASKKMAKEAMDKAESLTDISGIKVSRKSVEKKTKEFRSKSGMHI